ncbi:DUF5134 domain-containing protein [Mycolicibacterium sp.]|uniref:DUF5134 domain-containing protein n=1 Tax=Mycolicibacterium sp. TaxID=2320850 RepID=UPI001A1D56D7|nr:DUF5134 domain-containing protein [Mycolicibacterium sp.]MBJ7341234.1 DUF5134 domain-containing protein [Mycolicibacterium sp.]
MIQDLLVRWIVTALFVVSAAECIYAIATGRRVWTHVVGQSLHFVMAVAMAIMAWPRGAALPTTAPMVFFLLATVWFGALVLAQSGHRGVNAYHSAMMLAMAWMYAVMGGSLLPVPAEGASPAAHHGSSASSMPGMEMPGMSGTVESPEAPPFIVGLNWSCTIGFALATVWWLYRYFVARKADPTQPTHRFLGTASQVMMAAGMAIMFGVML